MSPSKVNKHLETRAEGVFFSHGSPYRRWDQRRAAAATLQQQRQQYQEFNYDSSKKNIPLHSTPFKTSVVKKSSQRARKVVKGTKRKIVSFLKWLMRRHRNKNKHLTLSPMGILGIMPSQEFSGFTFGLSKEDDHIQAKNPRKLDSDFALATDQEDHQSVISDITNDVYCLKATQSDLNAIHDRSKEIHKNRLKQLRMNNSMDCESVTLSMVSSSDTSAVEDLYKRDRKERDKYAVLLSQSNIQSFSQCEDERRLLSSLSGSICNDEFRTILHATSTLTTLSEDRDIDGNDTSFEIDMTNVISNNDHESRNNVLIDSTQGIRQSSYTENSRSHDLPILPPEQNKGACTITSTISDSDNILSIEQKFDSLKVDTNDGLQRSELKEYVYGKALEETKADTGTPVEATADQSKNTIIIRRSQQNKGLIEKRDDRDGSSFMSGMNADGVDVTPSKYPKGARWGVHLNVVENRPKWIETDFPLTQEEFWQSLTLKAPKYSSGEICDETTNTFSVLNEGRPSQESDAEKQTNRPSMERSAYCHSQRSLATGYTSLIRALSPRSMISNSKSPSQSVHRAKSKNLSTSTKHKLNETNGSVGKRVTEIQSRLRSKRAGVRQEERRETSGDGVLCPKKSKLINPMFRHHSSPTLPSMALEAQQEKSESVQSVGSPLNFNQTVDELREASKENNELPRLKLDPSVGIVKPAAMNIMKKHCPIKSKSDLCLSPKRRPPHQAQKWRTLAAAYGTGQYEI